MDAAMVRRALRNTPERREIRRNTVRLPRAKPATTTAARTG